MNRAYFIKTGTCMNNTQHASSPAKSGQDLRPIKNNFLRMNFIKILFVSLLVTATACSDDWVEVKNQNEQTTQDSYTTKEHAIAALTSCYDAVKWRSLFGLNYQYVFYALDDRILHENATFESFS